MNDKTAQPEIWQVEVNGQIYEANFKELTEWIAEGALLRQDKVRRGNLRWLEAGKIPSLHGFFNAKDFGTPPPPVVNETIAEVSQNAESDSAQAENLTASAATDKNLSFQNFNQASKLNLASQPQTQNSFVPEANPSLLDGCQFHPSDEVKFVCESCQAKFCKLCPKSYGGSVKICPMCGGMCKAFSDLQKNQLTSFQYQNDLSEGFGFADFGKALAYPFKFRFSLFSGALLFMFFSLGQNAGAMGGIFMIVAGISSAMMANALTFGCLANTVDNFAQGNTSENFMPSFDDFSLWDDVIHPFLLSIGVYLVSFGFLIVLVIAMIWFTVSTIKSNQNLNLPEIKQQVREVTKDKRINENGEMIPDQSQISNENENLTKEDEDFQELEKTIQEHRKAQLESVVGKDSKTQQRENFQMLQNLVKVGGVFILLAFAALLWGLFYFPAACAVAGYTRSFAATINPLTGLDTIRRLGVDYLKILLMCLLLAFISSFISAALNAFLSPLDLPGMGNLPAKIIGSLFTFYFSIVFAVILGFALYKNSAKLNLFR